MRTNNLIAVSVIVITLLAAAPHAQTPPPSTPAVGQRGAEARPQPRPEQAQPRAEQPRAPEPPGQPVNIKLELTITDQTGTVEPTKKSITMIVSDRQVGSIRTRGSVRVGNRFDEVIINVDAHPVILRDGQIRVDLGLEYKPRGGGEPKPASPTGTDIPALEPASSNLNQRISVILESGKPLLISQAADPASDRRIAVETTATLMK